MSKGTSARDLKAKWGPVVDCVADLLGPCAEVVLHDVRHPNHSIALIRNGHVTGRTVGAPLTDVGFFMLRESEKRIETLGVYSTRTDTGKVLKCNAVNLRDEKGNIEGILCINLDVNTRSGAPFRAATTPLTENYWTDPAKVIDELIASIYRQSDVAEGDLNKEQILELIQTLDQRGVFLARGAVRQVAKILKIAIPTVYKYLRIVRVRQK